ncbi:MAG: hypothetical protein AB1664_14640 [Thermodesulfobacteriota bacterium]
MSRQRCLSVTVDTSVWIHFMNGWHHTVPCIRKMLVWHQRQFIQIFASSRVFDPDAIRMHIEQQRRLRDLFRDMKIDLTSSPFRWGISGLGGPDVLSGPEWVERSSDDIVKLRRLLGYDPASLPRANVGNRLMNKIGDYDALETHYTQGRDVFVTSDEHDYFNRSRRAVYAKELGLIIQDPQEFVETRTSRFPDSRST